jgi:EmrB/QacA subfamily drug resistance transporter
MVSARALLAERAPLPRLARLPNYRWFVVGTVCVGAFLGQLDASIAGLVLPTLEELFGSSVAAIEWVAISYLLTLAALVVPFGRLADLTGRKTMYTGGFLVFIVGSALCGAAPTLGWLIVFRVLQAVGAALLQANSVAIITAAVDRPSLGRAIGIQGAAQAVGLAVGPSVGGFLIVSLGWRWVFYIAVPFGLIGAALGALVLPQTRHRTERIAARERFDWLGAALFGPSVALAVFGLTFANEWGWTSWPVLGSFGGALGLLAAFGLAERRAISPLVDFVVFRDRAFSGGILAGFLAYAVLFGCLFLVPFYVERVLGADPSTAGAYLTPVPLALGFLAPIAGIAADRLGPRTPTAVGMLAAGATLLALGAATGSGLAATLVVLAVFGVGLGLFTPANNAAVMASAPPHRLGVAGGILNMTRSVGTSVGVAATGAVLATRLAGRVGHPVVGTVGVPTAALAGAFDDALLFLAVLALAAGLVSLLRKPRISGESPEAAVLSVAEI